MCDFNNRKGMMVALQLLVAPYSRKAYELHKEKKTTTREYKQVMGVIDTYMTAMKNLESVSCS